MRFTWKRGLFRLWLVLTGSWIAFSGAIVSDNWAEDWGDEPLIITVPTGTRIQFPEETPSATIVQALVKLEPNPFPSIDVVQTRVVELVESGSSHQEIRDYLVSQGIDPADRLDWTRWASPQARAEQLVSGALRGVEIRRSNRNAGIILVVGPPIALTLVGAIVAWIIRGFFSAKAG